MFFWLALYVPLSLTIAVLIARSRFAPEFDKKDPLDCGLAVFCLAVGWPFTPLVLFIYALGLLARRFL